MFRIFLLPPSLFAQEPTYCSHLPSDCKILFLHLSRRAIHFPKMCGHRVYSSWEKGSATQATWTWSPNLHRKVMVQGIRFMYAATSHWETCYPGSFNKARCGNECLAQAEVKSSMRNHVWCQGQGPSHWMMEKQVHK